MFWALYASSSSHLAALSASVWSMFCRYGEARKEEGSEGGRFTHVTFEEGHFKECSCGELSSFNGRSLIARTPQQNVTVPAIHYLSLFPCIMLFSVFYLHDSIPWPLLYNCCHSHSRLFCPFLLRKIKPMSSVFYLPLLVKSGKDTPCSVFPLFCDMNSFRRSVSGHFQN